MSAWPGRRRFRPAQPSLPWRPQRYPSDQVRPRSAGNRSPVAIRYACRAAEARPMIGPQSVLQVKSARIQTLGAVPSHCCRGLAWPRSSCRDSRGGSTALERGVASMPARSDLDSAASGGTVRAGQQSNDHDHDKAHHRRFSACLPIGEVPITSCRAGWSRAPAAQPPGSCQPRRGRPWRAPARNSWPAAA